MIPMNDLGAQHASIRGELDQAIAAVLEHGMFINGPEVAQFEQNFAGYCSTADCVGVSNGTTALEVGLRAAGIGPGDEVVTSTFTFFATVEAIVNVGATPVLVDVDPDTALMTVDLTEPAITPATAAVIVVHLYGQPVDLPAFRALADERGLKLIEDAAQAHGAEVDGLRAGSVGDLATFSFFPGKNLGALGDAGAITTSDESIAKQARLLRNHGSAKKYQNELVGTNARLDTLQAAVLDVKLRYLDDWTARRRAAASRYDEAFSQIEGIDPIVLVDGRTSAHHLYTVRCRDRASVLERLRTADVASAIHYPKPLHRQPAMRGIADRTVAPCAEALASEVLSIPLYPELDESAQRSVVEAVVPVATTG